MIKTTLAGLAALALIAVPSFAQAQEVKWTLDNKSSHNVNYIYLSTPDAEEWGDDILGEADVVPAGQSATVTIGDSAGSCDFAVMFVMDTKQSITEDSINLCDGATYTLTDSQ